MAEGKYIAYYRVSTVQQEMSGLGLEAQRKTVLDYLDGRGWELLAGYTETETGTRDGRPELAKALEHAKKAKATLLIAKADRLSRKVSFIAKLLDSKVKFVACDAPQASRFEWHIRAALAEEESRLISVRTKAALAAAKARGVKLGVTGKDRAQENKARSMAFAAGIQDTVRELQAAGATTTRALALALNEKGATTMRGGKWHQTSVVHLLRTIKALCDPLKS